MGLIAFLGGVTYGLLHYFWLRNIRVPGVDDNYSQDTGKNILETNTSKQYY